MAKKTLIMLGTLIMVLTFGLSVIGCDDGGGGSDQNLSPATYYGQGTDRLTFTSSNRVTYYEPYVIGNVDGTYVVSGDRVTCTFPVPASYGGGTSVFTYRLSSDGNSLTVLSATGILEANVGYIFTKR